jgi:hypothetical protein
VGYSEVRGKRRVPCVEARIMAMYSGSAMVIDQVEGRGMIGWREERKELEGEDEMSAREERAESL